MKTLLIGADHAGFKLKEEVKNYLIKKGWSIDDITPTFVAGNDYPPIAKFAVAKLKTENDQRKAILLCGSGYGMDIVANRHKGMRAIVARSSQDAILSRQDDHSNILILGARVTKPTVAKKIIDAWLKTKPSTAERHLRRLKEIDA
ncbi:RpiB/LacA/LacB family sugar-phosphate isomerase [Candidatus Uhrbacteria bacterium]|nr:RpiB/LacA/LacB family sugar-phosphate isomerase [Candidatus Uhrbacteria bacterium]